MVTALGVSVGLTAGTIMTRGTLRQKQRWALDLLTLDKIGAWAITEPSSGSDAFGSMKCTARRTDSGYVLNGNKTFITNGPHADTIVFICKLDEDNERRTAKCCLSCSSAEHTGLTQTKPLRKMGLHSSPTGELFLEDVRWKKTLLGEKRDHRIPVGQPRKRSPRNARESRRWTLARRAVSQAQHRVCEDARAVRSLDRGISADTLKLAKMEVARTNIQNVVFRIVEMAQAASA